MKTNRYYLEINDDEDLLWGHVKSYVLERANYVEFNILYRDDSLQKFLEKYKDSLVEQSINRKKLYKGNALKFAFSNGLKSFIEPISFNYFMNTCIEDPSFYIDDEEIIATITHENQIYIKKSGVELSYFKDRGFKLKYESE